MKPLGLAAASVVNKLEKKMDQYAVWRAMLRGEKPGIHPDDPQAGFYRTRERKGGPMVPVAIWFDDTGALQCVIGGKLVDENTARERWQYIAANPITHEVHTAVAERGEQWPDIDPVVADDIAGAGHNRAPADDDPEVLRDQIERLKEGVKDYAKITSDEQAQKAQTLRSRLNELSGKADKIRETEKKPHWDAAKAVDALWQPLVKSAKEGADAIKRALDAHETAKLRAEQESRRKAEEEARKAVEAGKPAPVAPSPPVPSAPIKGAAGRAASVRVIKVASVTDQDAAYGYLKTHLELVDLIRKLAQRAVDAGHVVPGVSVEEQRRVA